MAGLSNTPLVTLLLILLGSLVISDSPDHRYSVGDTVPVYANKVGPCYTRRRERYDYYDFPFCSPDTVKEREDNLGKILTGERLISTPYMVGFLVDKEFDLSCKKRLTKADVSLFRSMIKKDYIMPLYYDDLPIWCFVGRFKRDFFDERNSKYFLFKHLDFEIFYNKDRVIEVHVQPDVNFVGDITVDKEIDVDFTYSIRWKVTNRSYEDRLNNLVASLILPHHTSVHGYSIANSCFKILILIICLLIFYTQVLHKDISRYTYNVEEAEVVDKQEERSWKNIHGDVFRFPKHKSLFAAALGSGSQLLILMVTIMILGVMGVFQPYHQGVFLKAVAIVYTVTSVVSGYTSVSFYHQLEGTSSWIKNLLLTGGLYFGPFFLTFSFHNTFAVFSGETDTLPLSSVMTISLVWMFLAFPLLLLGGIIGKNSAFNFQAPCGTTKCPKEVPKLPWYNGILPQMILGGFLPFSVIHIQLYDNFSTVWGHGIYTFYNSMSIMFVLLLITTALVSLVLTYLQLAVEDHQWWWRSFFNGGSTGLYVYGYGIYYYFFLSDLNSFPQTLCFFGYIACLGYAIFLALGTVGFCASLLFVRYLYASIKCD